MNMYNEIHVVFMPANATTNLQPMDQRVILIFRSYKLPKAATDSDSSDGSGRSKRKTFQKRFATLDVIKNTHDSWEEGEMSTLTGIGKKRIPTLTDDCKAFKTAGEEATANVLEITRELEL